MRALEAELGWTFPAIKKQVDSLEEAWILLVNKEGNGFSIEMKKELFPLFKDFFFNSLKVSLEIIFNENEKVISQYFWWKKFWIGLEMDLIVVYHTDELETLTKIKNQISEIFSTYFIENGSIVYMSFEEWQKRYRLSDRFVLQVMRFYPNIKV